MIKQYHASILYTLYKLISLKYSLYPSTVWEQYIPQLINIRVTKTCNLVFKQQWSSLNPWVNLLLQWSNSYWIRNIHERLWYEQSVFRARNLKWILLNKNIPVDYSSNPYSKSGRSDQNTSPCLHTANTALSKLQVIFAKSHHSCSKDSSGEQGSNNSAAASRRCNTKCMSTVRLQCRTEVLELVLVTSSNLSCDMELLHTNLNGNLPSFWRMSALTSMLLQWGCSWLRCTTLKTQVWCLAVVSANLPLHSTGETLTKVTGLSVSAPLNFRYGERKRVVNRQAN